MLLGGGKGGYCLDLFFLINDTKKGRNVIILFHDMWELMKGIGVHGNHISMKVVSAHGTLI